MSYHIVSIGVSQLGNVAKQKYCTEGCCRGHSLEDASSACPCTDTANRDPTH